MAKGIYKNSTEVVNVNGVSIYMKDIVDACLKTRLNLFLQGDTGNGKTQLAEDARSYFGDKSMFILGRNDMDTRDLFQQINLEKFRTANSSAELKELTDKVNYHLIVVDELPNCVPAVRAQLFNLFDGFVEINGKAYPIGKGYSVGIATGNIGQKFTESSNELGRALKDRMHVIIDVDYFSPKASNTLEILAEDTNPRVKFSENSKDLSNKIIKEHKELVSKEVPFEKLILANYLIHGLDYCNKGSKRKMKDAWPTQLDNHEQGSDVGLVLPVSVRAAKSILRLSQALDETARKKGISQKQIEKNYFNSVMQAYKLCSAYSGILNEADVQNKFDNDRYKALDSIISSTKTQYDSQLNNICAGFEMAQLGKRNEKVFNLFTKRWGFMKDIFEGIIKNKEQEKKKEIKTNEKNK